MGQLSGKDIADILLSATAEELARRIDEQMRPEPLTPEQEAAIREDMRQMSERVILSWDREHG